MGVEYRVSLENTLGGLVVSTPTGPVRARNVSEAARIAARVLGSVLGRAQRQGLPWGLKVAIGQVAAVYGSWPLLTGPREVGVRPSLIGRIRRMWRDS
jgi:hypothetical protein